MIMVPAGRAWWRRRQRDHAYPNWRAAVVGAGWPGGRGGALQTVTLVPVSITPRRADRRPAPELLHFTDVTLRTYLTSTEADAGPAGQ